jgi:site-specific recombinase XerD
MGVEFVKQYLGHKDIKNTIIYLDISDAEASAKAQEIFNV